MHISTVDDKDCSDTSEELSERGKKELSEKEEEEANDGFVSSSGQHQVWAAHDSPSSLVVTRWTNQTYM